MVLAQQEYKKAIVWGTTICPYCVKAKELLSKHNIEYEERLINSLSWSKEDLLKEVPNATKVPQIFLDGQYIGSYDALVLKLNS